jgi:transcriptional regulator with XRE-family HTH domain
MIRHFKNVADLIKSARGKLCPPLSQGDVATLLRYRNGQYISNIERGLCSLTMSRFLEATEVLKIPREQLIEAMVKDYESNIRQEVQRQVLKRAKEFNSDVPTSV